MLSIISLVFGKNKWSMYILRILIFFWGQKGERMQRGRVGLCGCNSTNFEYVNLLFFFFWSFLEGGGICRAYMYLYYSFLLVFLCVFTNLFNQCVNTFELGSIIKKCIILSSNIIPSSLFWTQNDPNSNYSQTVLTIKSTRDKRTDLSFFPLSSIRKLSEQLTFSFCRCSSFTCFSFFFKLW